ncbi:MAG: toxin-antitoxin system HicB family antitoxin [Rhodococcus sp.]|nr:toxin-antitoxin system HicB family antitoxin [Rhodococcus sp. (in: high G+C Gram-positive bacteria)]
MELNKYTDRLTADISAAAALGDEKTQQTAHALASAMTPAVRLLLLSALTDFADEVSNTLGDKKISVRLDHDQVVLDISDVLSATMDDSTGSRGDATDDARAAFDDLSGDVSRVTLRLVEQMKERAEEAASQNGVSLNSWVAQAVQGALREQMRRNGMDKF